MLESFVFSKNIEGFEFKPDAQPGTRDFSNNILALQKKSDELNQADSTIHNNIYNILPKFVDLKQDYITTYNKNNPEKDKYNELYIPDKTDLIQTINDVRQEDIHHLILQQNYIYIVGSITCATLLIAAIIIGKD